MKIICFIKKLFGFKAIETKISSPIEKSFSVVEPFIQPKSVKQIKIEALRRKGVRVTLGTSIYHS